MRSAARFIWDRFGILVLSVTLVAVFQFPGKMAEARTGDGTRLPGGGVVIPLP